MMYVIAILPFFAALVAIRGDTWDTQQSGLRAVTKTGWAAFALAAIALLTQIQGVTAGAKKAAFLSNAAWRDVDRVTTELRSEISVLVRDYPASEITAADIVAIHATLDNAEQEVTRVLADHRASMDVPTLAVCDALLGHLHSSREWIPSGVRRADGQLSHNGQRFLAIWETEEEHAAKIAATTLRLLADIMMERGRQAEIWSMMDDARLYRDEAIGLYRTADLQQRLRNGAVRD